MLGARTQADSNILTLARQCLEVQGHVVGTKVGPVPSQLSSHFSHTGEPSGELR